MPFAQFSPMVTSCKTIIQYHSQKIDIDKSTCLIHISPVLLLVSCVCLVLYRFITCVGSPVHHRSHGVERSQHHEDASCFPFHKHPAPIPNAW